jgi:hypothetical protein
MIGDYIDGLNLHPGGHWCTIEEMEGRFGIEQRASICAKLCSFLVRGKGCGFLYALIGGSFPTAKPLPSDLDITWFGPPGMSKDNARPGCAELMEQDKSRERFEMDLMYIPLYVNESLWDEQINEWAVRYGFDTKTGTDRGTLVIALN